MRRILKSKNILIVSNSFPMLSETFIRDHVVAASTIISDVYVGTKNKIDNSIAWEGYEHLINFNKIINLNKYYNISARDAIKYSIIRPYTFWILLKKRFNLKNWRKYLVNIRFKKMLREKRISHIHFHFGNNAKDFFLAVGAIQGIKISITFHGYDIRILKFKSNYYSSLINSIDNAIAISDWNERALSSVGFNLDQIKRINNPIDSNFFKPFDIDIQDSNIRIIAIGRLVKLKGFDILIAAFKKICELSEYHNRRFHLTIVGEGNEGDSLKRQVDNFDLKKNITFTGALNRKDVRRLLNYSNILVISSLEEALPTVMLEAMSMKLPIVATRVGSIPDHLPDTNILCQSADISGIYTGLKNMISRRNSWNYIGDINRRRIIDDYSSKVFINHLRKLYV